MGLKKFARGSIINLCHFTRFGYAKENVRMKKINYDFIKELPLNLEIMNLVSILHEYKGKQELFLKSKPQILSKLVEAAKIQSVDKSNKIEGIKTTDKRLNEIVKKKSKPKNRNEQEIAGYREVLDMIHSSFDDIRFSKGDILTLHKYLYKYSISNLGGKFKITDNLIEEENEKGEKSIRFEPVKAILTEEYVDNLCKEYNEILKNKNIEPLLLIPCIILDFLCIHPFNDGNGRMSRLLTLLLFYKAGYLVGKYISIEMFIEKTKETYYEALQLSSNKWHKNKNDYIPFLKYMLGILKEAYVEFESRFKIIENSKIKSVDSVYEIFEKSLTKVSKSELIVLCPEISKKTIERSLKELLDKDKIVMVGAGRTTAYIIKERYKKQ